MKIGSMRHRVTFQSRDETNDGYGGVTYTWNDVATTWAAVEHKSATGATSRSGQVYDRTQINFTIRKVNAATIRQGNRISWDGRIFDIQSVTNRDEQGRFLTLVATETELG
jgi:SPP1 family predicted phage head-tail adaptor